MRLVHLSTVTELFFDYTNIAHTLYLRHTENTTAIQT